MANAAVYARSSKDRSDISIAAQHRELQSLAVGKGLQIVQSFDDAVESGKDDDRPAFQDLIRAIKNRSRGWTHLLCLDTSRLARNRYIAQWIKRDCKRHGVEIIFAKMAETDPVTAILLESVFEGIDEWHSANSREKGLAGMKENVKQGWRAGGRAPAGYRLKHYPTGAMREGVAVTKSKLELAEQHEAIATYLRLRSQGVPRVKARIHLTHPLADTTLIGIEWNALVYAGHTVWNRHTEKKSRGAGGPKRRPRDCWVIERNTHPALITDAQAEALIAQLETSTLGQAISRAKSAASSFLLTGLLVTSDGKKWVGAGTYYRLKASVAQRGRKLPAAEVDRQVLAQITSDMRNDAFITALTEAARTSGASHDPATPIRAHIKRLQREKDRAATLALTTDEPAAFVTLVSERTRQIEALEREVAAVEVDASVSEMVRDLTPMKVRELLMAVGSATAVLHSFVDRIVLDPDLGCEIHYRAFHTRCLNMASPRGFEPLSPP